MKIGDFARQKIRELRRGISYQIHPSASPNRSGARAEPARLKITRISNQRDFETYLSTINAQDPERRKLERELAQEARYFHTSGFCFVCREWTAFCSSWDYACEIEGYLHVNWREHLLCPSCRLNNRMRATIHLLAEVAALPRDSRVYATEQSSPLFRYLQKRFPFAVGSEFLGDTIPHGQKNATGVRNEDLTCLTFPDEAFDAVLSFEVFEHIPAYQRAFSECARILKPGGKMFFCAPFDANSAHNQIRARLRTDGTIEHLLPPEYHYDPLNSDGVLCFQHFGWEMLKQLMQAGFSTVCALCYYSRDYGYLGGEQMQFLAEV